MSELEKVSIFIFFTVEAPVSGHPREAEKVSVTGTSRLRECVISTEFA